MKILILKNVQLTKTCFCIFVSLWFSTSLAFAQTKTNTSKTQVDSTKTAAPGNPSETAASTLSHNNVKGAPRPDNASGQVESSRTKGDGWRWGPRILFFPLRVVGEIIIFPIRGALWLLETQALIPRAKSIFFNSEGTFGLFPTALVETGFGLNVGARLVIRDLYRDTDISGRFGFGGRFSRILSLNIKSKDSFKFAELEFQAMHEVRPFERFFGIGNTDEVDVQPTTLLDPFGEDSFESRFKLDAIRIFLEANLKIEGNWGLQYSSAFLDRGYADARDGIETEDQLAENFDTNNVTNFESGNRSIYNEIELSYDARVTPSRWEPLSTPSTGWYAEAFAGYMAGLTDDSGNYFRLGFDLQRYIRLYKGPRFLTLRLLGEHVTGDYEDVAFTDLPVLGGRTELRGYAIDRFRDRTAILGSAEYQWDLLNTLNGFIFVDTGRVYSGLDDLGVSDLRLGFGGGIQAHTRNGYLGRMILSSSKDGGLFFYLSFDPIYETENRVERR